MQYVCGSFRCHSIELCVSTPPSIQITAQLMEESYPSQLGSLLRCGTHAVCDYNACVWDHNNEWLHLFQNVHTLNRFSSDPLCHPGEQVCWSLFISMCQLDQLSPERSVQCSTPVGECMYNECKGSVLSKQAVVTYLLHMCLSLRDKARAINIRVG